MSMESNISKQQLRRLGHVMRMEDSRLSLQPLHGEMREGERFAEDEEKKHKDHVEVTLKKIISTLIVLKRWLPSVRNSVLCVTRELNALRRRGMKQ